jgi:hypothetical protein
MPRSIHSASNNVSGSRSGNCDPPSEVRHLSAAEVRGAADVRRRLWTRWLRGEDRLFSSIVGELIAIYENAPNARIGFRNSAVYPRWEGGDSKLDFTYAVDLVAPA